MNQNMLTFKMSRNMQIPNLKRYNQKDALFPYILRTHHHVNYIDRIENPFPTPLMCAVMANAAIG